MMLPRVETSALLPQITRHGNEYRFILLFTLERQNGYLSVVVSDPLAANSAWDI
jgi:hypothetical protein